MKLTRSSSSDDQCLLAFPWLSATERARVHDRALEVLDTLELGDGRVTAVEKISVSTPRYLEGHQVERRLTKRQWLERCGGTSRQRRCHFG